MATALSQLRADLQMFWDVSGSTVLTTSEQNKLINDGYRALWAEVTAVNKTFRLTPFAFTIATGQSQAFPADFQDIYTVRRDPNTQQQVYLTQYGPKTGSQLYVRTYRPAGSNLVIEPLTRAPGSYQLDYIPQPPVLVLDADTLDAELDQWRLYIEYHAVIAAMAREEGDASEFFRMLYGVPGTPEIGVQGQVKQWAASKRSTDPDTIEDVRRYSPWQPTPP